MQKIAEFDVLNEAIEVAKEIIRRNLDPSKKQHAMFDIDDTIFKSSNRRHGQVLDFLHWLKRKGLFIHIVTAREDTPVQRSEVFQILKDLDILDIVSTVYLAPKNARNTNAGISKFKDRTRRSIARDFGGCFLISVGDRITDLCKLYRDENIDSMEAESSKQELVKCKNGSCLFGLKLEKMD